MWFANRMHRLPAIRPRTVKVSNVFRCPQHLLSGWENLKGKIERGEDLAPHLSRGINKINKTDGMKSYWQINHFHLGVETDSKHPNLVQGGSQIVYAILEGDFFYAISILEHGHWEDICLLDVAKKNWPTLRIFSSVMQYREERISPEDISISRKCNFITPTKLNDGTIFVAGGNTVAGTDAVSAMKACNIRGMWLRLQCEIEDYLIKKYPSKERFDVQLILNKDNSTFSVIFHDLSESVFFINKEVTMESIMKFLRD